MDFEEAKQLMTPAETPRSTIPTDEFFEKLIASHEGNDQHQVQVRRAAGLIREGLAELAARGHDLAIALREHVPLQFPRMLYKRSSEGASESQTVENQDALTEAKNDGWKESPQ